MKQRRAAPRLRALPILSYATGSGWACIGYAPSPKVAARIIRRSVGEATVGLLRAGFRLVVTERSDLHRELNGGPAGYTWSVTK